MRPAVAFVVESARKNHLLLGPLLFVVLDAITSVHGPVKHQLLVTALSWLLICIPTLFWTANCLAVRERGGHTAWLAGGFLALSQICDRAACDKEGIWATKGLVPLFVVLLSDNDRLSKYVALPTHAFTDKSPNIGGHTTEQASHPRSFQLLSVITISASIVLSPGFVTSQTSTLGFSSAIFAATGLILFENSLESPGDESNGSKRGLASTNGTSEQRAWIGGADKKRQLSALRDMAAIMVIVCGVASYFMESPVSPIAFTWEPVYNDLIGDWKTFHYHRTIRQIIVAIGVSVAANFLLFLLLCQQGAAKSSLLSLFASISARLCLVTSLTGVWFTVIYGISALSFTSTSPSSLVDIRSPVRIRKIIFGVTALSIGFVFFRHVSERHYDTHARHDRAAFYTSPPDNPFQPTPMDLKKGHPAAQLIDTAEKDFQHVLSRQSKTLGEAVQEYRRRNGIAPPPHFDKWFEFATRNDVVLVDEFDTVSQALLPFWALKPSTIRSRITYALGHEDSALIGIAIRDGAIVKVENGDAWVQKAITGMMKPFVQYLPDMDLGFNIHDEPRVIVPTEHLSAMVAKAREEVLPRVMKNETPKDAFSPRPADMNNGKRFEESPNTKFNRFAHQQTWTHSRLSCPADSQAQKFEDQIPDNLTSYATTPLNYVYNQTAFSDICNSPSLSSTFGFFERPNAFNVIHELTPVFSPSKISSFQDLLYPSPWYWFGKVVYDDSRDTSWENKTNSLYWRGSTTGGFSRNGGWRRQHRQRVLRRLNALDKASIHVPTSDKSSDSAHTLQEVERKSYSSLVDVKFSYIGQCDPGDCDAQKEFFGLVDKADGQNAWYYKHLLDMDGNALSGRFYAFMRSRSLTYKMALFREWHQEWLQPWVHYVPLSLIGNEYLDVVRWFAGGEKIKENQKLADKAGNGDSAGEHKAREIAERSREWAGKTLRNVDFEAWFFRLLLEYGRIVDDNRENIGYSGP